MDFTRLFSRTPQPPYAQAADPLRYAVNVRRDQDFPGNEYVEPYHNFLVDIDPCVKTLEGARQIAQALSKKLQAHFKKDRFEIGCLQEDPGALHSFVRMYCGKTDPDKVLAYLQSPAVLGFGMAHAEQERFETFFSCIKVIEEDTVGDHPAVLVRFDPDKLPGTLTEREAFREKAGEALIAYLSAERQCAAHMQAPKERLHAYLEGKDRPPLVLSVFQGPDLDQIKLYDPESSGMRGTIRTLNGALERIRQEKTDRAIAAHRL